MNSYVIPLSFYFNRNVGLAIPLIYIPYLNGKIVHIIDNNKYYKYMINTYNHYHLFDTILSDKHQWQEIDIHDSVSIEPYIMLQCIYHQDGEHLVELKFENL